MFHQIKNLFTTGEFKWIKGGGVASEHGFTFKRTHRFEAEYTEEDKTLKIYLDCDVKKDYALILEFQENMKWEAPHENEPLNLSLVKANISRALNFMKRDYYFD